MMKPIKGRVFIFGDNIDTDQIYPGRFLDISEHREIAEHVMEAADPTFRKTYRPGDFVVAGKNFGCGSSREHAVITLKASGVGCVLAESFARIFYRNAINTALPVMIVPGIRSRVAVGDEIEVDFVNGAVVLSSGEIIKTEKISDYILNIYQNGGVIPMYRSINAGKGMN